MKKIKKYIDQKREFLDLFLNLYDDTNNLDDVNLLLSYIDEHNILNDKEELKEMLNIISNVIKNHHQTQEFFKKYLQFFHHIEDEMKRSFSNIEIFRFFKGNKLFLLYLFENKIITFDEIIYDEIIASDKIDNDKKSTEKKIKIKNIWFFIKEISEFIQQELKEKIEKQILKVCPNYLDGFDEKRHNGQNESYICSLIRDDSIEEFVSYVNRNNIHISNKINPSIFETNSFLVKNHPTLIEYAAFFGSIQIFQYLKLNNVELTQSLWLYSIHGNNPEIIHLLEENGIEPDDKTYLNCLKEAIKCHHNDVANYIKTNLFIQDNEYISKIICFAFMNSKMIEKYQYLNQKSTDELMKVFFDQNKLDLIIDKSDLLYGILYHNYHFLSNDLNNCIILCFLCKYGYFSIVKLLLKSKKVDFNEKVILNHKFCKYNS